MLQGLSSADSFCWIILKELMDKINGLVADSLPLFVIHTELSNFDFLYYLIVISSVEWRVATKQNVQDDTNTPEITLLVVFVIKHLWGNVVRSTKLLVHFLTWVEDARSSKVDNCNLGVFLISAHENIFWLEIPVNNFSLVAIIY